MVYLPIYTQLPHQEVGPELCNQGDYERHELFGNPALLEHVDRQFRASLPYVDQPSNPNRRVLVTLSGPPGSGKTTLAQRIEQQYQGLRLESDQVRLALADAAPSSTIEWRLAAAGAYMQHAMGLLARTSPNKFWILDFSIDRWHDKIFAFAERHGFPMVTVAMDIPRETNVRWITERGDLPFIPAETLESLVPECRTDQESFLRAHPPDLALGPDYDLHTTLTTIDELVTRVAA